MLQVIDVNCDVGEHSAEDPRNHDLDILPWVSSCNVGCGQHGGDWAGIQRTVEAALDGNLAAGAHPSYPDRENFGRVSMRLPMAEFNKKRTRPPMGDWVRELAR